MDAEAWNRSNDPMAMLDAIRGIASERKLRLFSFALCQRLRFTPDSAEDGRAFLARAEQLCDAPPRPPGWALHAPEEEVARDPDNWYGLEGDVCGRFDLAWSGFLEADSTPIEWEGNPAFTDAVMDSWAATTILGAICAEDPWGGAREAAEVAVTLALRKAIQSGQQRSAAEAGPVVAARADVCLLLREVFGHPLRPPGFKARWRTGTVMPLTEGIYEARAFDRLPLLAGALQQAGCEEADILAHCRGSALHVRGCWVLDLVRSKE